MQTKFNYAWVSRAAAPEPVPPPPTLETALVTKANNQILTFPSLLTRAS